MTNAEFDKAEVTAQNTIHFKDGLLGFEDIKDYVLINQDEQGLIMTMQNADGLIPQFVVLDPYSIVDGYKPMLPPSAVARFKNKAVALKYLVIAVIKEDYIDTVVNLKSPIVIDTQSGIAEQIILENTDYSMKYRVFAGNGGQI